MLLPRVGGLRRLVFLTLVFTFLWSIALWILLPYDSPFRSFLRFTSQRVFHFLQIPFTDEKWLFETPKYPVDVERDIAIIIKTGFGTQDRVPAQLDAFGLKGQGTDDENVLVIADFSTHYNHNGQDILIQDMVAAAVQSEALSTMTSSERVVKYQNLSAAIRTGKVQEAKDLSKTVGWELDAMKFIPGLELAYKKLPQKKWYMMVDDDTYIVKPSLQLVLGHLDSSKPMYLGNAVGDYKGRFAHGGSSFLISQAAMSRLFEQGPEVVKQAYVNSLTESWGDKLVATTFMKVGVYLDERFSHFFNGERPSITRILADRFCSPLVSFHGLADASQMVHVGDTFRDIAIPVFWNQLWQIYGQPDLDALEKSAPRPGQDHVGGTDEKMMTTERVESADRCFETCRKHYRTCMAWTWEKARKVCHISPWIIIGDKAEGKYSGLNVPRVRMLMDKCGK